MTILLTGATGNVGARVVERLLARGVLPRVFVRDEAKARALFGDRVEVAIGDLGKAISLRAALDGIDTLFLVNGGPELAQRDEVAAQVAGSAHVSRIVKLSSMDANRTGRSPTGAWHAQGEDAVRATGLAYTFVQPVGFMSNALAWADSIRRDGVVRASTGDGKIAMIHPDDIADVSVQVLVSRDHDGQSLAITGPTALSYSEMVAQLGAVLGAQLSFSALTDAQAGERLRAHGMLPVYADALVDLWRSVREGHVATVTHTVERVLGRKPLSFETWVRQNASAFL